MAWRLYWPLKETIVQHSKVTSSVLSHNRRYGLRPLIPALSKAACKRTQQLPALLRQQCWELLRTCWQWCANGCNNSRQCWDLQCIVGRIQPISLCKPCIMNVRGPNNVGRLSCANGSNIVALRFGDHGTKEMLGVVDWKVWLVSNLAQQQAITSDNMQHGVQTDATCNIQQCCVRLHASSGNNAMGEAWTPDHQIWSLRC